MQFRFHPRLYIPTRTVAHALHQFAAFFVVFVVIFVTFAVAGMVLFGDRVAEFATLAESIETCVNMLFGNFDYATIQDLQAPVGMIYYWLYMIIVCLVLLNMMLAIVLDAYTETTEQAAAARLSLSFKLTFKIIAYDWRVWLMRSKTVMVEGRVVPRVLESALLKVKPTIVTESTLMELFRDTKLTREDTQCTMQFLLKGVACQGEDAVVKPAPQEPQDDKSQSKEQVEREASIVTPFSPEV